MTEIRFGTDGWRAVIARDYTFANVRRCAQGVAAYLKGRGVAGKGVAVGYDTRFASEDFAAEVAGVLAANGVPVVLSRAAAPTPVTSYNLLDNKAAGGVVITASHNPAIWNGFKYKPEYAGSASPEVVARLEEEIDRVPDGDAVACLSLDEAQAKGLARVVDFQPAYMAQLGRYVDLDAIRGAGLRVAVDVMHGAGSGYYAAALGGGATQVTELRAERNPAFPGMHNPEPIERNLGGLMRLVPAEGYDVGLAVDGDADRLGVVDETGRYMSTLEVFALLCLYLLEQREERGALVRSITTSAMVSKLGQKFDVPVYETPVGFKDVGPVMMERDALAGGEESGGYAFRGHIPERDGILSGVLLLDMMVKTGKRPSELLQQLFDMVGPHAFSLHDITFKPDKREAIRGRLNQEIAELAGHKVAATDRIDGVRYQFDDGAWVIVRFSGTEPLLRVYAEAPSMEEVERLLTAMEERLGVGA